MPESKGRAKPSHTPPLQRRSKTTKANPPWFVPVMLGLMLVGLFWVVTFYVTAGAYPIPNINYLNLGIGFGLMISGFMMTTRWR
ncbi:MAG: cell division protein CrgA [Actinobacteria bacterium]|nr:cell division protein CrgA [Actinomycetota bacterium]